MPVHLMLVVASLAAPAEAAPSLRERSYAQDQSALPALSEALASEDPGVRAEAAFGLGQLGLAPTTEGEPEPSVLRLTRAAAAGLLAPAVSDPDARVRAAAVEGLGKVGEAGDESFLLAAATDADPAVRGEAALALMRARMLKRTVEFSTGAVTRLLALAADESPEVRWRAVYAFSRWAEPRASAALTGAQADPDARVRLFAVRALGKLKSAPDPARLADPDLFVRAEAVAAFAAAKAWAALPDAVFADPSAHVRAAAADAAGESGDAKRFGPLLEAASKGHGTLAPGRAVVALARLTGAAAAPAVDRVGSDERPWLRARAAEASAFLPDAAVRLERLADDRAPLVAATALETMADAPTPAVLARFDRVLRDPRASLEARGTVVDAAGRLADPALLGGLTAAKAFATGPGSAELREGLIAAFKVTAARHPETAVAVAAGLKGLREFEDKPRRLKPLKTPTTVEFETVKGSFTVVLSTDAPVHAAAFAESVRKGFYDGLTWHRVVTAFVVQGGDPRGTGWGDAGWRLADEIGRVPFERGTVGMPKAGKDTGGCQFFVSLVPTPHLDGRYTAFGRVVSGMDAVDRLEPGDRILRARLKLLD